MRLGELDSASEEEGSGPPKRPVENHKDGEGSRLPRQLRSAALCLPLLGSVSNSPGNQENGAPGPLVQGTCTLAGHQLDSGTLGNVLHLAEDMKAVSLSRMNLLVTRGSALGKQGMNTQLPTTLMSQQ